MKPASYPKTPELDKMSAVKHDSQIIGAFLDHISHQGIHLAKYQEGETKYDDEQLMPITQSIEQVLADYFDIDLNKVEKERRAILDHLQSAK